MVYLVYNHLMRRKEVVKPIRHRAVDLDRFLREIRAVAKLRHPNIVERLYGSPLW